MNVNGFVFDEGQLLYLLNQIKNNVVTQKEKEEILSKFDGRSFKFVTQEEYDVLSEHQKADETIMYFITDAKPVQTDWNETDVTSPSYIKNKITKLSQLENDMNFECGLEGNDLTNMLTEVYGFSVDE